MSGDGDNSIIATAILKRFITKPFEPCVTKYHNGLFETLSTNVRFAPKAPIGGSAVGRGRGAVSAGEGAPIADVVHAP